MQGKITTNLKTINNQKCQKIKLHGTPTAKELKKKFQRDQWVASQEERERTARRWNTRTRQGWLRGPKARQRTARAKQGWLNGKLKLYSNIAVKYGRGCHCGTNSQSHRVLWKVRLEVSEREAFFPL